MPAEIQYHNHICTVFCSCSDRDEEGEDDYEPEYNSEEACAAEVKAKRQWLSIKKVKVKSAQKTTSSD